MAWEDLDAEISELFGTIDDDRADSGEQVAVDRREYLRAAYRERWNSDPAFRRQRKRYFRERRLLASKPIAITEDERHM